jgi:hypothetical protein
MSAVTLKKYRQEVHTYLEGLNHRSDDDYEVNYGSFRPEEIKRLVDNPFVENAWRSGRSVKSVAMELYNVNTRGSGLNYGTQVKDGQPFEAVGISGEEVRRVLGHYLQYPWPQSDYTKLYRHLTRLAPAWFEERRPTGSIQGGGGSWWVLGRPLRLKWHHLIGVGRPSEPIEVPRTPGKFAFHRGTRASSHGNHEGSRRSDASYDVQKIVQEGGRGEVWSSEGLNEFSGFSSRTKALSAIRRTIQTLANTDARWAGIYRVRDANRDTVAVVEIKRKK